MVTYHIQADPEHVIWCPRKNIQVYQRRFKIFPFTDFGSCEPTYANFLGWISLKYITSNFLTTWGLWAVSFAKDLCMAFLAIDKVS